MINEACAKAYKEVLEIIKYFPEKEYNKIPKEKIDFFKQNMDSNYKFSIDPKIELSKQNISKEANAIVVALYEDYYATESERKKIKDILRLNELKNERKKRKKYNPNIIFKTKKNNEKREMVEYKENIFTKIKKCIIKIFKNII